MDRNNTVLVFLYFVPERFREIKQTRLLAYPADIFVLYKHHLQPLHLTHEKLRRLCVNYVLNIKDNTETAKHFRLFST